MRVAFLGHSPRLVQPRESTIVTSGPSAKSSVSIVEHQLDPEDIILLLIEASERLLNAPTLNGITRLEKVVFLLVRETEFQGIAQFFVFKAHHFGPFSKEIYEAVDFLAGCELITVSERAYPSFYANVAEAQLADEIEASDYQPREPTNDAVERCFALTENGRKVAQIWRRGIGARGKVGQQDLEQLDGLILRFGHMPLNQLIRYVYRRHPDMTTKSIHPEAQNSLHVH